MVRSPPLVVNVLVEEARVKLPLFAPYQSELYTILKVYVVFAFNVRLTV